jgi:hypothetical protein
MNGFDDKTLILSIVYSKQVVICGKQLDDLW